MDLPDFLIANDDGEICLKGHRIRLIDVAARYEEGRSAEGILFDYYPTLNLALIHKTIAFYLEHELAVREMMARNAEQMRQLMAEADAVPRPSHEELRRRLEARHRAEAS